MRLFRAVDASTDLPALEEELHVLVRLGVLRGHEGPLARRIPALMLRPATRETTLHGYADHDKHEIVVIIGRRTDLARARATLLHEVVHLGGFPQHDRAFKSALIAAAKEAWNIDVSPHEGAPYRVIDAAIERELRWQAVWAWVRSVASTLWTSTSTSSGSRS